MSMIARFAIPSTSTVQKMYISYQNPIITNQKPMLIGKYYRFLSSKPSSPNNLSLSLWTRYNEALQRSPLMMKGLTSGFLAFVADIVCQFAFPSKDKVPNLLDWKKQVGNYDIMRTIKFTVIGAFYTAPLLHYWYGALGRVIQGSGILSTMGRLTADQTIFAPAYISVFFAGLWSLDGESLSTIKDKLQAIIVPTLLTNYTVWIPAQFINFYLIPPHLQVLYANFIGFFWNIYLSYAGNQSIDTSSGHLVAIIQDESPAEHDKAKDSAKRQANKSNH